MGINLESASLRQAAANSAINAPESVEVVPTGRALGAEVRGMDLSRISTRAAIR